MMAIQIKMIRDSLSTTVLDMLDRPMDRVYGKRKRRSWGKLAPSVLEIGAGTGANFRYYPAGTHVIAVEPNPAMADLLKKKAAFYNMSLDVRKMNGEDMDLPNNSVSTVVGTLVMCSVDDPEKVISEIRRVLIPGGRYFFLEHVAALSGCAMRRFQTFLRRPWHLLFDGCHLDRNTHTLIAGAGFERVDMDCFRLASPLLPFAPHIIGQAIN